MSKNNSSSNANNDDKMAHFNGGGSKPITEKQKEYIYELSKQKDILLDEYVGKNSYNKINNFTGSQANKLIRELKSLPYV